MQRLLELLLGQGRHYLVDARRREMTPNVRERVGFVAGKQIYGGRAPEPVDHVGG